MEEIVIALVSVLTLAVGGLVYVVKKLANSVSKNKGHCCYFNGCWDNMKDYINKICKEKK